MLCHVCLMSSEIYALCKPKCTENLSWGKHLNGSTGQDVAKLKLSLSLTCMDTCTLLHQKTSV